MKTAELDNLTIRELFILARDLWEASCRVDFKEPYKTLLLYAKFPDDTPTLSDEQELIDASLSEDETEASFTETVLNDILSKNAIPKALQHFMILV